MQLSCSSLNNFIMCEKTWLNKQLCLSTVDFPYFRTGREGHEVVQRHISKKKLDDRLTENLKGFYFPIVEEKDFDERLKFDIKFGKDNFIGFLDARNDGAKVFSDIKISTKLWTMKKFVDLMQRKVYQYAYPDYSFVGITATPDLKEAETKIIPCRPQDAEEARKWIVAGFKAIKNSDFKPNPKANCQRCVYQNSCPESRYNV